MTDIFSEPCKDGLLQVVRVDLENLEAVREARKHISDESWKLYTANDPKFNELERMARKPPPKPGDRGTVFFAMTINGEIVGLSNHYYFDSEWENYCVRGGLIVLDKHQRRGIATAYSKISVRMARHMGVICFYGQTRQNSPMHKLRKRQGWEMKQTFKKHGEDWINIRLKL